MTSIIVTIALVILDHLKLGRKPFILILHSSIDVYQQLTTLFKNNGVSYKFKSRNYTGKGYDYAIEFTVKNIEELNQALSNNEQITKYSIIEYDADDIV